MQSCPCLNIRLDAEEYIPDFPGSPAQEKQPHSSSRFLIPSKTVQVHPPLPFLHSYLNVPELLSIAGSLVGPQYLYSVTCLNCDVLLFKFFASLKMNEFSVDDSYLKLPNNVIYLSENIKSTKFSPCTDENPDYSSLFGIIVKYTNRDNDSGNSHFANTNMNQALDRLKDVYNEATKSRYTETQQQNLPPNFNATLLRYHKDFIAICKLIQAKKKGSEPANDSQDFFEFESSQDPFLAHLDEKGGINLDFQHRNTVGSFEWPKGPRLLPISDNKSFLNQLRVKVDYQDPNSNSNSPANSYFDSVGINVMHFGNLSIKENSLKQNKAGDEDTGASKNPRSNKNQYRQGSDRGIEISTGIGDIFNRRLGLGSGAGIGLEPSFNAAMLSSSLPMQIPKSSLSPPARNFNFNAQKSQINKHSSPPSPKINTNQNNNNNNNQNDAKDFLRRFHSYDSDTDSDSEIELFVAAKSMQTGPRTFIPPHMLSDYRRSKESEFKFGSKPPQYQ